MNLYEYIFRFFFKLEINLTSIIKKNKITTMEIQYKYVLTQGKVENEEGFFFKALPFEIKVNQNSYHINFERGADNHVTYTIKLKEVLIASVVHPDYIPNCEANQLNQTLNTKDAEAIFAGMVHVGISIDKAYQTYFNEEKLNTLSFTVIQHQYNQPFA